MDGESVKTQGLVVRTATYRGQGICEKEGGKV
jgi:hypothetical protein